MKPTLKKLLCAALTGGIMFCGSMASAAVVTDKAPILTYADHTVPTYDKPGGKRVGFISPNVSLVQVKSIRSDGWAYGSYAIADGKRVTRWFEMRELQGYADFQNYTLTIDADRTVYRTSQAAAKLGSVLLNAKATVIGEEGNYLKIIYRVNGGSEWKMGWIERGVAPYYDGGEETGDIGTGEEGNKPSSGDTYYYDYHTEYNETHNTDDHSVNVQNTDDHSVNSQTIDDHSTHDSHDVININEPVVPDDNPTLDEPSGQEYVLDGSTTITHPFSGDYHKVKISGWSNSACVDVKIGLQTYVINRSNPDRIKKNFEAIYTLSANVTGTKDVLVEAVDATNQNNRKEIGRGQITISIPPNGAVTMIESTDNAHVRVKGWANTDKVELRVDDMICPINSYSNPNHGHVQFDETISLSRSITTIRVGEVFAINAVPAEEVQIGRGTVVYHEPTAHDPTLQVERFEIHDYNKLLIYGTAYDEDDTNRGVDVVINIGGGTATIHTNPQTHRFSDDITINVPEFFKGNFNISVTAKNLQGTGGNDTTSNLGDKEVESPIVEKNSMRIASGNDGIMAGSLVLIHKEDRANGTYYVQHGNGMQDWSFGNNYKWVSRNAVGSYDCRWGRVTTSDGKAPVYASANVGHREVTSKGHEELVKKHESGKGILITGRQGNFYTIRYHSYESEDNIVKDRWILVSDIEPI